MKKRRKVVSYLLLTVIALAGALLYLKTLDRGQLEESPDWVPLTQEKDPAQEQDVEADSEPEGGEEEDFRVEVRPSEYPVLFEDGDYENLDKARLIWMVNNLFTSIINDIKVIEDGAAFKFHVNGREVESNFYLKLMNKNSYYRIVEEHGVYHLVFDRDLIERYIEASKYAEITSELNDFIDRLNRMKPAEIVNLTEAQIDAMLYIDLRLADEFVGIEKKREELRILTVDVHIQSTNVFEIEEGTEKDLLYPDGDEAKSLFFGSAFLYYRRENFLRSHLRERIDLKASPPPNFDPRLHTDPDAEPFIWVPVALRNFIYDDRKWKMPILNF